MNKQCWLIILFLACRICNAQSVVTFNKLYTENVNETALCIAENDSGYLNAIISSSIGWVRDLWIIQIGFNGDTLWQKKYGNSGIDGYYPAGLFKSPGNDGYFFGGSYFDFLNNNVEDAVVGKFDLNGDTLWTSRTRIADKWDAIISGIYSSDNYIALAGRHYDTSVTGQNLPIKISFFKADTVGNFVAAKFYPNPGDDIAGSGLSIAETPNHGYMICGYTNSTNVSNGGFDFLVMRLDSIGNLIWQQGYGGAGDEYGAGILRLSDGNYLIMGQKIKARMYKIDINGNVIWQRNYNTSIPIISEEIYAATELPSGDIVTVGSSTNTPTGYEGGWVMRLSSNGYKIWERYFKWDSINPGPIDNLYRVIQTSDGGLLFCGFGRKLPTSDSDAWLWKLDENGCDSTGCATLFTGIEEEEYEENNEITAYPNPFIGNNLTLTLPIMSQDGKIEVTFFNNLGQVALTTEAFAYHPVRITIYDNKLLELPAGMYFIQLKTKRGVYSAKVLKQ